MLQHTGYLLPHILKITERLRFLIDGNAERHGIDKGTADFLQLPVVSSRRWRAYHDLPFP